MSKKSLFLTAALLAVILISGCTGGSVRGNTWPGLFASGNVAYLADGPFVYGIDLENGTELWRYPGQRDNKLLFYTTPYLTSDGLVIVGGCCGQERPPPSAPHRCKAFRKSSGRASALR